MLSSGVVMKLEKEEKERDLYIELKPDEEVTTESKTIGSGSRPLSTLSAAF